MIAQRPSARPVLPSQGHHRQAAVPGDPRDISLLVITSYKMPRRTSAQAARRPDLMNLLTARCPERPRAREQMERLAPFANGDTSPSGAATTRVLQQGLRRRAASNHHSTVTRRQSRAMKARASRGQPGDLLPQLNSRRRPETAESLEAPHSRRSHGGRIDHTETPSQHYTHFR